MQKKTSSHPRNKRYLPLVKFIVSRMKTLGYNAYRLSLAAKAHQSTIGRILDARGGVGNQLRPRLAAALGVTEADLLAAESGDDIQIGPLNNLMAFAAALNPDRFALLYGVANQLFLAERGQEIKPGSVVLGSGRVPAEGLSDEDEATIAALGKLLRSVSE